ncbi:MAG TPA: phosphate signaling complex protein PhoU [Planctomycetota bacterium]|nr:phosphate signaling complex protein PhoU [Planctomycetota bacterium]
MHRHFDEEIKEIRRKLVEMGSLAESMIASALRALLERNERHCQDVALREEQVNELQIEIDDMAVKLTALQQPVGSDVRFLFMATRITSELERIGDQAINICQGADVLLKSPPLKPFVDIPIMAEIAQRMVRDSLEGLVRKDVEVENRVLQEEDKVDAFRDQIFRELLTYMMADPATIPRALALILISRNLERVGDHATNIAEEVIYWVQGRDIRHHHEEKIAHGSEGGPSPEE